MVNAESIQKRWDLSLALALAATLPFVVFTVWWLADGGSGLDAATVSFTDRFDQGALDAVSSETWRLGEPQFAVAIIVATGAWLAWRRNFRAAALVAGGFLVLSGLQLAIAGTQAVERHVPIDLNQLAHLYPSGHTARVPYIGTALALLAPNRVRGYVLAATALAAVAVALDRSSSGTQTGSAVFGGMLLGLAVSAWLLYVFSMRSQAPARELQRPPVHHP